MSPEQQESIEVISIVKPGVPAVVDELAPVVAEAQQFEVVDVVSNTVALERIKSLRAGERYIHDKFEKSRKAADAAKKEILALRDGLVGPIQQARMIYDRTADVYEQEQRRLALEEEQRLRAIIRKQEEDRLLQDAIAAEEAGDTEQANLILEEKVEAPIIAVAPQVATVKGVSTTTRWSAEVVDLLELVKHVAKNPEWISLLDANMPNLNRLAVSQHEALSIPGVRAVSTTGRSTRS